MAGKPLPGGGPKGGNSGTSKPAPPRPAPRPR